MSEDSTIGILAKPGEGRESWAMKKSPNPVDKHVGSRIRTRRLLVGLSQEKLGEGLGITFQQIQKYEKGTNRISASRLQQASRVLGVPVEYFYEGGPQTDGTQTGCAEGATDYVSDFLMTNEGIQLMKAFMRIKVSPVRRRVIDLIDALGEKPGS
jgi:transcriptional regulator with XRE-family HTH domain